MCAATDPSEVGASPGDPAVPVPEPEPVAAEVITSRRNPLVGRLRSLHDARGRRQSRQLLLEGTHLIEEMLRIGLKPDLLVATPVIANCLEQLKWLKEPVAAHKGERSGERRAGASDDLRRASDWKDVRVRLDTPSTLNAVLKKKAIVIMGDLQALQSPIYFQVAGVLDACDTARDDHNAKLQEAVLSFFSGLQLDWQVNYRPSVSRRLSIWRRSAGGWTRVAVLLTARRRRAC